MRGLTRREFVAGSVATGFALAVRPISAETIHTGPEGLEVGTVQIPVPDRAISGYRAMPQDGGPFPAIIVVHEIFGVHEHIRDVCRRLARRGYCAVAPDLFARHGDVTAMGSVEDIISKVVRRVADAQVLADIDATVAWLDGEKKADASRLGITGFCWGGRIVWTYAAHSDRLDAGVAWYGRLVGEASELTPRHPIDIASSLKAPVLGLYGDADQGIPTETVERMRATLKQGDEASEIVVYPDAPHGFHADYRPSYRSGAASDGWKRMLAWFAQHGVAA
jgi:carboxymethylenebutenolidase